MPTLSITFFSAASFPFAFPPTVARGFGWPKLGLGIEGVNARVEKWLLETLSNGSGSRDPDQKIGDHEPRLRGWALMDFYVDPGNVVVPLLVECNFRGRSPGEEGWI
jgi:1-phosphatidylinositol phosphodiesterase